MGIKLALGLNWWTWHSGVEKWQLKIVGTKYMGRRHIEICNNVKGELVNMYEGEGLEKILSGEKRAIELKGTPEINRRELTFSTIHIGLDSTVGEEFVEDLNTLPRYKALIAEHGDFPHWDQLEHAAVIPTAYRGRYNKTGYQSYFDTPEDESTKGKLKEAGVEPFKLWYDANKDKYPVFAIALNPRGMTFGGRSYDKELWDRSLVELNKIVDYLRAGSVVFMTPGEYAEAYWRADATINGQ